MSAVLKHSLQIFLLSLSFCHHLAFGQDLDFAKSLSLYHSGKVEESYSKFENVFESPKSSTEQKVGAAMVLAYAPQSKLKRRRHEYALYALENQKQFPARIRLNLIRVVGDGYFNDRDFPKAENFYNQLGADSDVRNQAYAEYRLGWIDLNHEQGTKAFQRWALFIQNKGKLLLTQDADLFKSILLDSGRAWAEASELETVDFDFLTLIPIFEKYHSVGQDFEEGIVLALKRFNRPEILEKFRKNLEKSSYYTTVVSLLLKKKTVFETFPCEIARWEKSPSSASSELIGYVNQCAKRIAEKKECAETDGVLIQDFYQKFDLKEKQLLPRISLSVSCKNWAPACRDFLDLAVQTASKSSRLDETSVQAMIDSCTNIYESSAQIQPEIAQKMRLQMGNLLQIYSEKKLFQGGSKDQIYSIASFLISKDAEFRSSLIQNVLKQPRIYSETLIPDILIEAMSVQEKAQYGLSFLTEFKKTPLSALQVSLFDALIQDRFKAKNLVEAESLLKQFIPLTEQIAKSDLLSGYWEFYWIELDEAARLQHQAEVASWLGWIQSQKLNREKQARGFGLAIQYDLIPVIWTHWATFSKAAQTQPNLRKIFYQKTSDLLAKDAIPVETLMSNDQGKILVRLHQHDASLTSQEVKKTLGDTGALGGDLASLDQLRSMSAKLGKSTLKLNGYLPQVLRNKMKTLQQQEKLLVDTQWSSTKYLETAKSIFENDAKKVIAQIEGVKGKADQNAEMAEFSAQLQEIIRTIEEQVKRLYEVSSI